MGSQTPSAIEIHGFPLAFDDRGEGPPLLLVHGTACDRELWRELVQHCGGRRTIAYDRRGYGDSGAPEPYGGTTVEEQAEDAVLLLESLGVEGARACGHGFGALVALDLMRRRPDLAADAVLVDPPLLWLLATGSEVVAGLREEVERGAREGGPPAAVAAWLHAHDPGWRETLGPERAERAGQAARPFAADLAGTSNWDVSRRELRAISVSVRVVTGSRSPQHLREASQALAALLPSAELLELDGGYLLPIESAAALSRIACA